MRAKSALPGIVAGWLDASDPSVRFALLKLITGALRVGVSARLAQIALSEIGRVDPDAVEEVWHGLAPPYLPLFAWIEGRAPRPDPATAPLFRPPMLAQPLEQADIPGLDRSGLPRRVEVGRHPGPTRCDPGRAAALFAGADDISGCFPGDHCRARFHAVLDGELLVVRGGRGLVAPFADLQQRLNRKTAPAACCATFPVGVRLYDLLFDGEEDLRAMPFDARRARLEAWFARVQPAPMDLSPLIAFSSLEELSALRLGPEQPRWKASCLSGRQPLCPGPTERVVVEMET